MARSRTAEANSVFSDKGLRNVVAELCEQTRELYLEDDIPWVVGYSGGKDSTAVLQLVWLALAEIPENKRTKPVYVISTDTLVENPVVSVWVSSSLKVMKDAALEQGLPIEPHSLVPEITDTFWVNLIGKGYPAPRHKFRWCTERLKIKPSNTFISNVVRENGEAILVLGTRKAESSRRAHSMKLREKQRIRDNLSPNASLPNSLVYTPVENWTNDDVWMFLMQYENPWGYRNKDLLTMYQGASPDGECPLVIDSTTPSCGDSRFGCWTCTLVEKDRSMAAMIQNDEEKEWMLPLLELRDELDVDDDKHLRDFRRLAGHVQIWNDKPIPGPYTQEARGDWLRRLLQAQRWIRDNGPAHVRNIELITLGELQEISRIWVIDKHEIEDLVPLIYEEVMNEPYPGPPLENQHGIGLEELDLLKGLCGDDKLHYELLRGIIHVASRYRTATKRIGYFKELEDIFKKSAFSGRDDAVGEALSKSKAKAAAQEGDTDQLKLIIGELDDSDLRKSRQARQGGQS